MLDKLANTIKITQDEIGYKGASSADSTLVGVLNLAYAWAAIIAVIVLIVGGILFVESRGSPEKVKRSKDAIKGAVVGLIVILAAFAFTEFLRRKLV